MHAIEPYWNWRHLYTAEEDVESPFYGRIYSEFEFTDHIYDFVIHPQWDNIGSSTLFLKLLFCDYDEGYAIIELIGEWNDCLYNDIMHLKRNIADHLIDQGISQFILIGENVLNFHASDDCYYEEWFEDIEDGWIALLNMQEHVLHEMSDNNLDHYFVLGGKINEIEWRKLLPHQLKNKVEAIVNDRILLK